MSKDAIMFWSVRSRLKVNLHPEHFIIYQQNTSVHGNSISPSIWYMAAVHSSKCTWKWSF